MEKYVSPLRKIPRRHRTTENVVVVVGGGIAGSTAAYELHKKGIPVELIEKRSLGSGSNERSEMTLSSTLRSLDASEGVTQPLTCVKFISLDNGRKFEHSMTHADHALDNVTVAINHNKLVASLWNRLRANNIPMQNGVEVTRIEERKGEEGVDLEVDGNFRRVRAVVNAAGPSWRGLPFADHKTQQAYENALVAVAYGARCRGRILHEDGDRMMLHPVSLGGSGRTSWVNPSGDDEIEIVFSDYSRRKDVGLIDRKLGFDKLIRELTDRRLIEIKEIGPTISGFFGLEARRRPTGNINIFHHGERGQFNAATVGDAIAPTVRLSPVLASVIAEGKPASEFEKATMKTFNHKLELATTRARLKAKELGRLFDMFNVVKWMTEEEQLNFLRNHSIPKRLLPLVVLRYPHIIQSLSEIATELVKIYNED